MDRGGRGLSGTGPGRPRLSGVVVWAVRAVLSRAGQAAEALLRGAQDEHEGGVEDEDDGRGDGVHGAGVMFTVPPVHSVLATGRRAWWSPEYDLLITLARGVDLG